MSESLKENTPKTSKSQKLSAVKGMNDILPPESARWEWLEAQVRCIMARYAYGHIRTPIVEPTSLTITGLAKGTEIRSNEKSQYEWHFETNDGDVFTIYDWKEYYDHDSNVELNWHIGGHGWMSNATAKEEIVHAFANASEAIAVGEDTYVDHYNDPKTSDLKGDCQ